MGEPRDYHIRWNKSERERNISYYITLYVKSKKKKDTSELIYKIETQS